MLVPVQQTVLPTAPTLAAKINGGQLVISFASQTGATYQVQYKNALGATTWSSLGNALPGTGSTLTATDSLTAAARFYRVVVTQP